ncbi:hypothetical protein AB0M39_41095 [Streptomyces sp. NPDC051907]|uniref:hypothetical protein n=1 Tax=Streptomyces sp. NPDC051907 TaxID=3155284 RepID=UPI0034361EAF
MTNENLSSAPQLWFRLPPGYHSLDNDALSEVEQVAMVLMPSIMESPAEVASSLNEARTLVRLLTVMRTHGSVHTAVGVHPDEDNGACISLFSLSVKGIALRTAALAVAQSALALAKSPLWSTSTGKFITLPTGVPAALVSGLLAAPHRDRLESEGITTAPCEVFQARLTVPFPTGVHLAVADLTSAAVRHAGSYTDVLEGIAQTIAFDAPSPAVAPAQRPSRILELLS